MLTLPRPVAVLLLLLFFNDDVNAAKTEAADDADDDDNADDPKPNSNSGKLCLLTGLPIAELMPRILRYNGKAVIFGIVDSLKKKRKQKRNHKFANEKELKKFLYLAC